MWQSSARGRKLSEKRSSSADVNSRQRNSRKTRRKHTANTDFEWLPVRPRLRQESFLRDCDSVPLCVCTLPWSKRGCTCNRDLFAFSRSREVHTQHQAAQTHYENEDVAAVGCDDIRGEIPSPPDSSTVLRGPLQVAPPQTRPPRVILPRHHSNDKHNSVSQTNVSQSASLATDFRGPRRALPPRNQPRRRSKPNTVLSTSLRPTSTHGSPPSLGQHQIPVPVEKQLVAQQSDASTSTQVADSDNNVVLSPGAQSKPRRSSAKTPRKTSVAPPAELNHGPRIVERRTSSNLSHKRERKNPSNPIPSSVAESSRSTTAHPPPGQESTAGVQRTLSTNSAKNATAAVAASSKNIFSPEVENQSYLIDGRGMLEQSYLLQRSATVDASGSDSNSDAGAKPHYLQANYILRPMPIASRPGTNAFSSNDTKVEQGQHISADVETVSSRKVLPNDSCTANFRSASEALETSLHELGKGADVAPRHALQTVPQSPLQEPESVASLVVRADELQSDSNESAGGQAFSNKQVPSTTVHHSEVGGESIPRDASTGFSIERHAAFIHQQPMEKPLHDDDAQNSSASIDEENDDNESNHSSSMSLVEDFSQLTEQLVQEALQKALHVSHTIDVGVPDRQQHSKHPETTSRETTSRPAIDASLLAVQKPRNTTAKQFKSSQWRFGNSSTSTARFAFVTPAASQTRRELYSSNRLHKRSTPFIVLRNYLHRRQQPNVSMTRLEKSPSMDVQRRILSALQRDHFFDGINVDLSDGTETTDEFSRSRDHRGQRGEFSDPSEAVDDAGWEGGLSDFETVGSVDDAEFRSLMPEKPAADAFGGDNKAVVPPSAVLERLIDRDHKRALPQQPHMLLSDTD